MTFPVARQAALSSLALALASPLSIAQTAASPAMASVLVTATRSAQPAGEVLSDYVLISSQDIERSGATTVIDLLQKQRGVEVTRNGGPGASSSVFIRGADSKQNVVLVDGVRIGSSTTGAANWTALPLASIDRIEIVYGPLATMYGADAIGGVVQIFTRRGAGAPRISGALSAGSDKARLLEAGVAGGTARVSYAISASQEQDDGFSATLPASSSYNADNDGYEKDNVNAQLVFALAQGHEAGLLYMHSHLKAQYDSGKASYDVRSVQDLDNIALFSKHQLTPQWSLNLQAAQSEDQSANFTNASATGTSQIYSRQKTFSAQSDVMLGSDLLQLVLERREEDVDSSATAALSTGRTTNSAGASYSMKRGSHIAIASMRQDDSSQYGAKATGGLGYGYRLTRALRVNASAGTSFRAPTFNELYYPGFGVASNKPEHGKNLETGLYFNDGRTEASVVYFHNRLTDLLVNTTTCPVEPSTHPTGCAYNVNRATLAGLTIGARSRLGNFDVHGAFDLQDPRDDTSGKTLVRRARRHAKLGIDYTSGPFAAGVGVQLSGERFDDLANRNKLGGYGLVNLFASYAFAPDWSAVVRWNNVADKQYELARNYATAGSQVFAGIRYGIR